MVPGLSPLKPQAAGRGPEGAKAKWPRAEWWSRGYISPAAIFSADGRYVPEGAKAKGQGRPQARKAKASEAAGRQKGDGKAVRGKTFPRAPGGSCVAAGDQKVCAAKRILRKKAGPKACFFVEYRGVEPLTYRLRTYRSSQLS